MKKILLCFLSFLLFNYALLYAQKQNNIWIFGEHSGLNFNSNPPAYLDSTPIQSLDRTYLTYGSSICDSAGNLKFYTDGLTVWNYKNKIIPKYLSRWPWSLYVIPLICPYPGNDSLFYIFGVSAGSYANRLQYLTINVKGNYGYGDIVYPQPSTLSNYFTLLKKDASVFVAGTAHCNKNDTWIVTHSKDAFYSYLVTARGVDSLPVVSVIPTNVLTPATYQGRNIKFSASGEKLIFPLVNSGEIAVFNFNSLSGLFTNGIKLKVPEGYTLEDAEISPDGSKLYFGASRVDNAEIGTELHYVFQMDLDAGTVEKIEQSALILNTVGDRTGCSPHICYLMDRTLQLGPDGKIYVSMRTVEADFEVKMDVTLSVIEEPNEKGVACRYKRNGLFVKRKYRYLAYNYIRSSSYTAKENGIQYQKTVCSDKPVKFSLLFNKVDSVRWNFGDPASSNNFSTSTKPEHTYPAPGTYTVKAVIYNRCVADTAIALIKISKERAVHIPDNIKDSIVCKGGVLMMDATTPNASEYAWGGGNTKAVQEITVNGRYEVKAMNACSVDSRVFNVQFLECDCKIFIPNAFTPNDDGLNDIFKPITDCFAQQYRFSVYNRFGGLIFTSTNRSKGWNGRLNNQPSTPGVYVWVLQYQDPNNRQFFKKSGTVTVLR